MKPIHATAALLLLTSPAFAQIAVTDTASIVQQATSAAKDLAAAGERLAQLRAQLSQAEAAYQAVTGVRDLGGAVNALGMVGVSNPLPINPSAVQNLMNGTGGVSGISSSISGLYTGSRDANRAYTPSSDTWIGRELGRSGSASAGAQALALELYRAAGDRATAIEDLRCQIEAATDPATRESLIAQLTAAQAAASAQNMQATALGNYAAASKTVDQQRVAERRQEELDEVLNDAKSHGVNTAAMGGTGP